MGEMKRDPNMPQFCDACFTGQYAVELTDHNDLKTGTRVSNLQERKAKG